MNTELRSLSGKYIPSLDGLRAVAVTAVILYHMDVIPFLKGGFTGVDIFFVLSGYVISRSICRMDGRTLSEFLSGFYRRRVLRIIPALMFCLLLTHLMTVLFIPFSWKSEIINSTGLSAFFGAGNFVMVLQNDGYFSPHAEFNPFLHTWSLAVEEQFYVLFPLMFFTWMKFRGRKNVRGVVSVMLIPAVTAVSFVICMRLSGQNHDHAYYFLHSRFWELSAGALLFMFQVRFKQAVLPEIAVLPLFSAGMILIACGALFSDALSFPFPWALLPVSGTMAVIFSLTAVPEGFSADAHILDNRLMVYIGRISYSLYLWHWPVITMLRWTCGYVNWQTKAVSLAATFMLSILSFHFIENPVRKNRYMSGQGNMKIVFSGILFLVTGFSFSKIMFNLRNELSLSVTRNLQEWQSGRYSIDRLDHPVYADRSLEKRKIFALGDSHTAAYRTMLNIFTNRTGSEAFEFEAGDCSVAGLLHPMNETGRMHYADSLAEIKKTCRPGDVVFLASLRMPELSSRFETVDVNEVLREFFSRDSENRRSEALNEADMIITEFENLGLNVVMSAPEPVLLIPPYRCSDWFNRKNPIAAPGAAVSNRLLHDIRSPVMDSIAVLKKLHPELVVWDPFDVLCTGETFSAYDPENGLPVLYDGDHFSGHGNRMLEPSFEKTVLKIWGVDIL